MASASRDRGRPVRRVRPRLASATSAVRLSPPLTRSFFVSLLTFELYRHEHVRKRARRRFDVEHQPGGEFQTVRRSGFFFHRFACRNMLNVYHAMPLGKFPVRPKPVSRRDARERATMIACIPRLYRFSRASESSDRCVYLEEEIPLDST